MRLLPLAFLVACGRPALTFAPDKLPDATVGQPYHATIEITGNHTPVGDISATSLPPGLSLTYKEKYDSIATIEGTPTAAGRAEVIVDAWCYGTNEPGQKGHHVYDLVVH